MNIKIIKYIILCILGIAAGFTLLIMPEKTSYFVIRGAGFLWILDGINYGYKARKKYYKKSIRDMP